MTEPITAGSLEEKTTVSPVTGRLAMSFTVAVAVLVETPLATIEVGNSCTVTVVAGPTASAGPANAPQPTAVNAIASALNLRPRAPARRGQPRATCCPTQYLICRTMSPN